MDKKILNNIKAYRKNGFTLMELLIVMAVIGVLSTLSIFALKGARESARDAKRKADLEAIRSALEMYKADNNVYPGEGALANETSQGSCGAPPCGGSDWNAPILAALEPKYIQDLPVDPINSTDYYYQYEPTCNQTATICQVSSTCTNTCCSYDLRTYLESGTWYWVCNP